MVSNRRLRDRCTDPTKCNILSFHWSELLNFPLTWCSAAKHWQAALTVPLVTVSLPSKLDRHHRRHWSVMWRDWEGKQFMLTSKADNAIGCGSNGVSSDKYDSLDRNSSPSSILTRRSSDLQRLSNAWLNRDRLGTVISRSSSGLLEVYENK